MSETLSWDHIRHFLAVVRLGSLSAAARELGATQPTVGRQIDALERQLGRPLFTRSRHGLHPTASALELLPHARSMAQAADTLVRSASDRSPGVRGTVRISASQTMGVEVLPRILADLMALHPGVRIELALDDRPADLLRRDADIAVRMFRPTQGALRAARAGRAVVSLYAHQDYVARMGLPRTPAELAGHTLIGYDRNPLALEASRRAGVNLTRLDFAFRCDSESAQLAALRAGLGIGACQHPLARQDRRLIPVLPNFIHHPMEVWVAMHTDLRKEKVMALCFQHLLQSLRGLCGEA